MSDFVSLHKNITTSASNQTVSWKLQFLCFLEPTRGHNKHHGASVDSASCSVSLCTFSSITHLKGSCSCELLTHLETLPGCEQKIGVWSALLLCTRGREWKRPNRSVSKKTLDSLFKLHCKRPTSSHLKYCLCSLLGFFRPIFFLQSKNVESCLYFSLFLALSCDVMSKNIKSLLFSQHKKGFYAK